MGTDFYGGNARSLGKAELTAQGNTGAAQDRCGGQEASSALQLTERLLGYRMFGTLLGTVL